MAGALNWNRPGAIFVATPATVQLLSGNDRLVVVNTVKVTPEALLLKENWKRPLANNVGLIIIGGVIRAACVMETG